MRGEVSQVNSLLPILDFLDSRKTAAWLDILGQEISRRIMSTPNCSRNPFIVKWASILEIPIDSTAASIVCSRHTEVIEQIREWHWFVRQYQSGKTSAQRSFYHLFFATAIGNASRNGTVSLIETEPILCASIYWRYAEEAARTQEDFIKWCCEQEKNSFYPLEIGAKERHAPT
jgi:hypothetical protein